MGNEVQVMTCTMSSGSFYLKLRGKTTAAIPYSSTASQGKAAIEASIAGTVTVTCATCSTPSSDPVCKSAGEDTTITFLKDNGDVPSLSASVSTGASSAVSFTVDGASSSAGTASV